ncbi:MAG: hypothetical protein U5K00_11175 [Melioribacteraceae bacterium]|nr:hypothetical protein [Melioribacteraceae bacterium]
MSKAFIFGLLSTLFIWSCSNYIAKYDYDVKSMNNYENETIEMVHFGGLKSHYTNDFLELYFDFNIDEISFQLNNVSSDTLIVNLRDVIVKSDSFKIITKAKKLVERPSSPYELIKKDGEFENAKIDSLFIVRIPPNESYRDILLLEYEDKQPVYINSDPIPLVETSKRLLGNEYHLLFPFISNSVKQKLQFLIRIEDYYLLNKG